MGISYFPSILNNLYRQTCDVKKYMEEQVMYIESETEEKIYS
jgi:hypothetical protein